MDNAVLSKSVTKDDDGPVYFQFLAPNMGQIDLMPDLQPMWSRENDQLLRRTPKIEGFWATAVMRAINRVSSRMWEIEGEVPLRVRKYQELFLAANTQGYTTAGKPWGKGWTHYLNQHLHAYLLTDNGAFTEVVYNGAQVIGFIHLDPDRCWKTGDALHPVIYQDSKGREHSMAAHEVFHIGDYYGQADSIMADGQCAARDVYDQMRIWHVIQRYLYEKGTGRRPQKAVFIGGLTPKQLKQIRATGEAEADARGLIAYMGALMTAVPTEQALSKVEVDLVGMPDWFKRREEFEITTARYAGRLGLDPADLAPQRLGGYGSGGMARMADEKAKEAVLASWQRSFLHSANFYLMDALTRFRFSVAGDASAKREEAETVRVWSQALSTFVTNFILTPDQALQVAVDNSDGSKIPLDFLKTDQTEDSRLLDDDRPSKHDPEEPANPENASFDVRGGTKAIAEKAERQIKAGFIDVIRGTFLAYREGEINDELLIQRMKEIINRVGATLYRGGAGIEKDAALTGTERNNLAAIFAFHESRLLLLSQFLHDGSTVAQVERRADLWALKLMELYWLGLLNHREDPYLIWDLGQADHCKHCRALAGQVHKASEWRAAGWWPQSKRLDCNGFCRCGFRKHNGPAVGDFTTD